MWINHMSKIHIIWEQLIKKSKSKTKLLSELKLNPLKLKLIHLKILGNTLDLKLLGFYTFSRSSLKVSGLPGLIWKTRGNDSDKYI